MKKFAIEQAQQRLTRAKTALARMIGATTAPEIQDNWEELISVAGTIYSKLEQGAKGDVRSQAWFARRKRERTDDPLLQYAHQARNSAEHSIEKVASQIDWSVSMRAGAGTFLGVRQMPDGTMMPVSDADPNEVVARGPHLELSPVTNRGVKYDPPRTHLGRSVEGTDPTSVGQLLVAYLDSMVEDSQSLPIHS